MNKCCVNEVLALWQENNCDPVNIDSKTIKCCDCKKEIEISSTSYEEANLFLEKHGIKFRLVKLDLSSIDYSVLIERISVLENRKRVLVDLISEAQSEDRKSLLFDIDNEVEKELGIHYNYLNQYIGQIECF